MLPPASRITLSTSSWVGRGLLAIALVFLLREARPLLLPVAVAVVFAFVLSAPVRALEKRGVPPYLGSLVVLAAALGALVGIGLLIAAPAAAWWSRAPLIVHDLIEAAQRWLDTLFPYATPASLTPLQRAGGAPVDSIATRIAGEGWVFTRLAIGETFAFALSASASVMLLYFLLASERFLVTRTVAAFRRPRTRALVLSGFRQAERDIGLFIASMIIVNVALGIATGLGLWAIGMPNPVLWGTTTAVLACVPYLGPALVAVLLLLAGSVSFGTGAGMLAPPAVFLALHAVEANFLTPIFMGHRLRMSPVVVFGAVLGFGWLWGVAGTFLAVPILLALRVASQRSRSLRVVRAYLE